MTDFDVVRLTFDQPSVADWSAENASQAGNWPVVYTLSDSSEVYVGETLSMTKRASQHLANPAKNALTTVHVIVDGSFNKSACLDLESQLIGLFSGDGIRKVLNRNAGIVNADYYNRRDYQVRFGEIFDRLRDEGLFSKSLSEIRNSDLFKLSPFKALTDDQGIAVGALVDFVLRDLAETREVTPLVVRGDPGTGKTVVAIYLLKLLADIKARRDQEDASEDLPFAEFFTDPHAELLAAHPRWGLVIPQQSLRKTVQRVFDKTPGLERSWVLSPFDVGTAEEDFDLLVVDEAHRLSRHANQPSAMLNNKFRSVNEHLFGSDDPALTQLDWIAKRSRLAVLMLDEGQSVRPLDLSSELIHSVVQRSRSEGRYFELVSQMRIVAVGDYVAYVRDLLHDRPVQPRSFGRYDMEFFDALPDLVTWVKVHDERDGLSRLVAGYAWSWKSKKDPTAFDIEEDGARLQWNRAAVDWVNSPNSVNEVGSIHTIQGYDLNWAGVIIGRDLRFDEEAHRIVFCRESYFDKKGKENNVALVGMPFTDEQIADYVRNVYAVLLTRGIRGTAVWVADPALREHLRPYFTQGTGRVDLTWEDPSGPQVTMVQTEWGTESSAFADRLF